MEAYRVANADSIAAVEARHAEEVRRRAAEGEADTMTEALSGTAAAFEGGRDAEPHQGMDYTAQMPSGALAQAGTRWEGKSGRGGAWWGVGNRGQGRACILMNTCYDHPHLDYYTLMSTILSQSCRACRNGHGPAAGRRHRAWSRREAEQGGLGGHGPGQRLESR